MSVTIKLRKGLASEWASNDTVVLASGEPGFELDTGRLKIGDGTSTWANLDYASIIPTGFLAGSGIGIDLGTNGSKATIAISGSFVAESGTFDQIIFNTGLADPDLLAGQLQWNATEGTLDLGLNDSYAMHLGEEMLYRVRNITGSTLLAGQPVYASGLTPGGNNRIEVNLYAADGNIREIRFMGLMTEDLADNGNNGYATHFGYIRGIDTRGDAATYGTTNKLWDTGEPAWNEGDILYVHPTVAGKLTKVEPKHSISVAIVTNKANNGKLFVRPTSYGHLNDNHDVNVSGVTDGQYLQYNEATDYWIPTSSGNFTVLDVDNLRLDGNTLSAIDNNGSLVIAPNGTGALVASSTGNSRGANSVDLQTSRSADTQVASGASSVIGGGRANTASGDCSTLSGGYGNTACGTSSTVGGGSSNTASAFCATVSGGGGNCASGFSSAVSGGRCNAATNIFSTVSGGYNNDACGSYSTVGGGRINTASGYFSTVSGGGGIAYNGNTASGYYSTVSGGGSNCATGSSSTVSGGSSNNACATNSSVSGGRQNFVNARHGSINGGHYNVIQSPTNECCARGATIGGGIGHNTTGGTLNSTTGDITGTVTCCNAGHFSTISGGFRNIATGTCSTVGGGKNNTASGNVSTVGGGDSNKACGNISAILGGNSNLVSSASSYSSILGGNSNQVCNSYSSIGGGLINTVSGYYGTISGGYGNCIGSSTSNGFIGNGYLNCTGGTLSSIVNGAANLISGQYSSVLGGSSNSVSANYGTILGGTSNCVSCQYSFIAGNCITTDRSCTLFVNNLSIKNIPTCCTGLPSGSVFSCAGVLRIIP